MRTLPCVVRLYPDALVPAALPDIAFSNDLLIASVTPPRRESLDSRLCRYLTAGFRTLARWSADVVSWFGACRSLPAG